MEDDDEIHSLGSPETGSPASPRPNGRITVTVAAAPPVPAQPPQNILTLALPIQQPRAGGGSAGGSGGGGGREDCWSEAATAVLIEAWGERYLELSRGNLKQKHWQEVADIVCSREDYGKTPKTDVQCKNRIDTVKKKYKLEKSKIIAGGGPSKWPFFHRLDELIGPSAKIPSIAAATAPKNLVGARSAVHYHHPQKSNPPQKRQMSQPLRMRRPAHSVSTESEPESPLSPPSVDSADSFPPERKRPRFRIEPNLNPRPVPFSREKGWGSSVKELTQAIMKFGEAYEHAETTKMQQVVEIEKQRMRFAKELELQRMQFFMETQVELSQFKRGGGGGRRGGGSTSNHHQQQQQHHHNNTSGKNNRSDSSN